VSANPRKRGRLSLAKILNRTELDIQKRLYWTIGTRRAVSMPNVYVFDSNESDFVTVTKAGYIDEYEIKVTRSDLFADRKKHRHISYQHLSRWRWRTEGKITWLYGQRAQYPNRFWYVVPERLVREDEVPLFAGLMFVSETGRVFEVKKAPKLHGSKAAESIIQKIVASGYHRYLRNWANGSGSAFD